MHIARVQVEEGFLDGLDLKFKPGLNVVIGPRGSGKTSVVELIRYCLGVKAITEAQDRTAVAHALAILGSGTVAVTLADGEESIRVVRGAEDDLPRSDSTFPRPLIVSQNEIEEIGLRAESRLELIDRFDLVGDPESPNLSSSEGMTESLTRQMASLRAEIETMRAEVTALSSVPDQLTALSVEQKTLKNQLKASEPDRKALEELSSALALIRSRQTALDTSRMKVVQWRNSIAQLTSRHLELEPWPEDDKTGDWLAPARRRIEKALEVLEKLDGISEGVVAEIAELGRKNKAESVELDDRARMLRKRLEAVTKGAGEVSKKIQDLEARKGKLATLQNSIKMRVEQLAKLKAKRDAELDRVEARREARFERRRDAASQLNRELKPLVRIEVHHAARHEAYISAIAAALRGSGTKYNIWAPKLAAALSPRELVTAIEEQDAFPLVLSVDRLSEEQATRMLSQFDPERLGAILTAEVEDDAQFSLFDGSEYKPASQLSTGQRCTVVLPILLRQALEPLVIDQPEDHLDNAFIVDSLVQGMRDRKTRVQIVCTTHNANIPVLGEAEQVIAMGSDGSHAFVSHAGSLEDNKSVHAITTIMEGGLEAFKRRAAFYGRKF